jgi:carbon-monoxide dehydrogenase large subunit
VSGRHQPPRTVRREDARLIRGSGTFIDGDRRPELDGAVHAVFVRSTEPHARLVDVDISDARQMPGVVAVFTGDDAASELWPLPPRLPIMNKLMVRPMLGHGTVRFVGEPIAVVLAESRQQAADAAEAVVVDYDPLPAVTDIDEALDGGTLLHDAAATNVSYQWALPDGDDDMFAGCDTVVELSVRHPRLNAAPIEPRQAAVWWADGRCTILVSSQRPAGAKYVIECSLGLEPGTVRAIAPDLGGGFGAKGGWGCHPEDVVVAWASRRVGRAVRWSETRTEAMLGMAAGRASTHHVRIGASADGRILAYEVRALQDSGAYPAMGTFITNNLKNAGTGVYAIPRAFVSGTSVVTNTTPTSALRGAGRPEAAVDIERAVDRLAMALNLDPVELRRRNLVGPDSFPYTNAVGATYDSGRYEEALDRCLALAGYEGLRAEQARRRAADDPMLLGIGISCTTEPTGGGDLELAKLDVADDGTVSVIVGTSPHGQAHETTFAAIVAAELGLPDERVVIRHSDTDLSPTGGGTIGSRSAQLGGAAAYGAAKDVIELAKDRAAELLEAARDDIVFDRDHGRFHVAGTPARSLGWVDVGPLHVQHDYKQSAATFAFGACVAAVEVDRETGAARVRSLTAVDDAGTVLQPQLAEGQVHGGLALGIAAALYEEMAYEPSGVPRTANFADYAIVSAAELPSFEVEEMETPSPINPLGVKGVGESGTVMSTPAIHSAVIDALAPFDVEHLDLPMTPERIWRAIEHATTTRTRE